MAYRPTLVDRLRSSSLLLNLLTINTKCYVTSIISVKSIGICDNVFLALGNLKCPIEGAAEEINNSLKMRMGIRPYMVP